jgi:hypothetical protein
MLSKADLWLVEEPALDEPSDILAIPEIRQFVAHDQHDDELGLRSLLERPEAMPRAWREAVHH